MHEKYHDLLGHGSIVVKYSVNSMPVEAKEKRPEEILLTLARREKSRYQSPAKFYW